MIQVRREKKDAAPPEPGPSERDNDITTIMRQFALMMIRFMTRLEESWNIDNGATLERGTKLRLKPALIGMGQALRYGALALARLEKLCVVGFCQVHVRFLGVEKVGLVLRMF